MLDHARDRQWSRVKEALLAQPELINAQPVGRYSALHYAALANDHHMVDWLLARGANPMVRSREHRLPVNLTTSDKVARMLQRAEDSAWNTVVTSYSAACAAGRAGASPRLSPSFGKSADRYAVGPPVMVPQLSRGLDGGRGAATRSSGPPRMQRMTERAAADFFKDYEGVLEFDGVEDMSRLMLGGLMDDLPHAMPGHPRLSRMLSRQFLFGGPP